jgi:hypothetical protein
VWALHALALYRSGRQVEALEALRTLRAALADELGLDPTPQVQELEQAMLRQDGTLRAPVLPPRHVPDAAVSESTLTTAAAPSAPAPSSTVAEPSPAPGSRPRSRHVVGRDAEQKALADLLAQASAGRTRVGVIVGEPGIGKSELLADLADRARDAGFSIAVGRCSQDDGAPPLWPFLQVLRDLGHDHSSARELVPDGEAPSFGTWERITQHVLGATRVGPVLVVVDDLHWGDEATHRALAHLLSSAADDAPLLVVVSRRTHPAPSGTLALAAEALARRQSLRLDLRGLDVAASTALVHALASGPVEDGTVAAWHQRCEGNPFYLAELARLGVVDAEVDAVPGGVLDVVRRRLVSLPSPTQEVLQVAAVLGRSFLAGLVAATCDLGDDTVTDELTVAAGQGLVRETSVGSWAFAHALTRDAVLRTLTASQAARHHARVAQLLAEPGPVQSLLEPDERTSELARHWAQAGPAFADRAWPAAKAAADQARAVSAHLQAARLRREAVTAQRRGTRSSPTERYDLLLDLAEDAARAAVWPEVEAASREAVALGRDLGDPERVATAGAAATRYALWTPHEWGEVQADVVDDLRWALAELPSEDSPARCRLLLSLAVELYYDTGAVAERDALVRSGLAAARRLDDDWLRWWACRAAWLALWLPARVGEQLEIAVEALQAAERAGDPAAEAVAALALAANQMELHGPLAWPSLAERAGELARRHRLPYVEMARHLIDANLASLRGDTGGVEQSMSSYHDAFRDVAVPGPPSQVNMDQVLARLWDDSLADLGHLMDPVPEVDPMLWPILHVALARTGRHDALRAVLARQPLRDLHGLWSSTWVYCFDAEAAAAVGDTARAARLLPLLRPLAGRMCIAGIAIAQGPVDGYLALAAATAGQRDEARRHADQAEALAHEWDLPRYLVWLRARRDSLGT